MLVTIGTGERQSSQVVDFLVVDCPFAYNAILGRLTLNLLRAITSTYHLLMCFPSEGESRKLKETKWQTGSAIWPRLRGGLVLKESMSIDNLEV